MLNPAIVPCQLFGSKLENLPEHPSLALMKAGCPESVPLRPLPAFSGSSERCGGVSELQGRADATPSLSTYPGWEQELRQSLQPGASTLVSSCGPWAGLPLPSVGAYRLASHFLDGLRRATPLPRCPRTRQLLRALGPSEKGVQLAAPQGGAAWEADRRRSTP